MRHGRLAPWPANRPVTVGNAGGSVSNGGRGRGRMHLGVIIIAAALIWAGAALVTEAIWILHQTGHVATAPGIPIWT